MLGKLTEDEINEVLGRNLVGRIGCVSREKVYVVPVSYVYDGKYIIAHSTEGEKIRMMREDPRICFEVDELDDLTNWRSVIAWGDFEELTDEEDKYFAMKKLVDRFMHLKLSETARPPHLGKERVHPYQPGNVKAIIWRMVIKEKTGRFEKN